MGSAKQALRRRFSITEFGTRSQKCGSIGEITAERIKHPRGDFRAPREVEESQLDELAVPAEVKGTTGGNAPCYALSREAGKRGAPGRSIYASRRECVSGGHFWPNKQSK